MATNSESVQAYIDSIDPIRSRLADRVGQIKIEDGSIHVVVSTGSGQKGALEFYRRGLVPLLVRCAFIEENTGYTVYVTRTEHSVTDLTENKFAPLTLNGKQHLIILLSGDGGIVDLVNGLASSASLIGYTPPLVAIIPMGTANALAYSSGAASDNTCGLRALTEGEPRDLATFRVSFSTDAKLLVNEAKETKYLPQSGTQTLNLPDGRVLDGMQVPTLFGAVVCSWGLHAAIVADSDTAELRKHGGERFKMAANENLFPPDGSLPHEYKGEVWYRRGDKWTHVGSEHGYVLATTVSNLEKTFRISPKSKPLDGSLHLVQFGPLPGPEVIKLMEGAYKGGEHIHDAAVLYEAIDALFIKFEKRSDDASRWRRICIDGKIVVVNDGTEDGWVLVEKNAPKVIKLLAPPE